MWVNEHSVWLKNKTTNANKAIIIASCVDWKNPVMFLLYQLKCHFQIPTFSNLGFITFLFYLNLYVEIWRCFYCSLVLVISPSFILTKKLPNDERVTCQIDKNADFWVFAVDGPSSRFSCDQPKSGLKILKILLMDVCEMSESFVSLWSVWE